MAIEANYTVNYPDLYSDYAPKPSAPQSLYPDLDFTPSAPPIEVEVTTATSAPPVEKKVVYGDCSICLENCTDAPEGDSKLSETISKTACKHFFHDYCLQKWMANADNSCPNCRAPLAGKEITHIVWDEAMTPKTTVAKPPENVSSFQETASNVLAEAGKATLKASLFAASVLGLVAWEGAKLTGDVLKQVLLPQETPEVLAARTKQRKQVLGKVHQEFVKKHEALIQSIQKQDMDMRLMLGKVVSVCDATHPRQHTIMDAIDKVQKRLASQTESFQRDMRSILADVKEIESLLNVTKSA